MQVNGEDTEVSEVLTFDEIVQELAKDKDISIEKAEQQIIGSSSSNKSRLQSQQSAELAARSATYRTISRKFEVTTFYEPSVKFYVQTTEAFGIVEINEILNVGMNRDDDGFSKQFGGDIYTNLESRHKIFFIVNGDFYDNGTTTVDGSVSIGIGQSANVTFNISHTDNHYEYVYVEDTIEYR